MADMFSSPIPGQSLTREKGNAAWEQPPQYTKVEEVFRFYLEKFEEDDAFNEMLYIFDKGMPIDLFVDSLLISGEMKGIHLFDMGFMVGPLLHEYFVGICTAADINFVEFQNEMEGARVDKSIEDFMNDFGGDTGVLGDVAENVEEAQDMSEEGESFSEGGEGAETEEEPVAPPTAPPSGGGLMRRPQ